MLDDLGLTFQLAQVRIAELGKDISGHVLVTAAGPVQVADDCSTVMYRRPIRWYGREIGSRTRRIVRDRC